MVIIFILLGLGFLGGGIALIVEGWPYMVLERGFTQVIAGTVLASAGVVLLALSRVLSELGRVRSTLSNALMAASLASMTTREEPALSEAFALEPVPRRDLAEPPSSMPAGAALGGAAAGVLAGIALARAGTGDHAAVTDEKARDVDLFGVVAPAASEPAGPVDPAGEETALEPVDDAERLPFDDAGWLDRELAREPTDRPAVDEVPLLRPDGAADQTPSRDDDPFAGLGEPFQGLASNAALRGATAGSAETEFDFLRESLAHLRVGRSEDAPPPVAEDDIADAAAWMSPARAQASATDEPVEALESPAWPPSTQSFSAGSEPQAETDSVVDRPAADAEPQESEPAAAPALETLEAEAYSAPEDAGPDAEAAVPAEPPAPAASDEGVIGAYQVGEAHFTIYADGSIQARTPDGDYRFDSMDELKTYLASEKSRLGM